MKIMAYIPVQEIRSHGCTTYRHEMHEVDVVRIVRYQATRYPELNRWRYLADIADHPSLCASAIRTGFSGSYRVNVVRRQNPRWKPPLFNAGRNVFEVKEGIAA